MESSNKGGYGERKVVNVIEETKEQQDRRMAWWREAKFGMFIHWSLGSVSAGMREGVCPLEYGSFYRQRITIPIKEDEQLAKKFNPVRFNAKEWVQVAKEAGMRWVVPTVKSHDGFCLFDTKLTDYNIVKAAPFKRDPFKELAEACREEGMRLGFHYSQRLDWHHPDGGNYWDYDSAKQSYSRYVREYVKPQIRELLTNYGPIAVIWFDMGTPTPELAVELKQLVRQLQPDTIVNNRIGEHPFGAAFLTYRWLRSRLLGDYTTSGDHEIPEERIEGDWETPACTNDSWYYCSYDHNWKSGGTLIQWLVAIVSRGGNYLLNVGPTDEGIIPEPCVRELKEVGEWLKVNGESIYGATASPIPSPVTASVQPDTSARFVSPFANPRVAPYQCTAKPGKYYIHMFAWPWDGRFKVFRVSKEVKRVYLLADPNYGELEFNQEGEDVVISVPDEAPDPIDTVVVLEINK